LSPGGLYITAVPRTRFIPPSAPIIRREPPVGPEWIHELKHDGFRAQLHLRAGLALVFGKNGGDLTRRFRAIAAAVAALPYESVILDAELVACDPDGMPNFYALMRGAKDGCCAYCFDLLELDGRSLVARPLEERRGLLRRVMRRAPRDTMRLSEAFDDPHELLAGRRPTVAGAKGLGSNSTLRRTCKKKPASVAGFQDFISPLTWWQNDANKRDWSKT
jgi:bifunctional non-homologous end joining protein LigD